MVNEVIFNYIYISQFKQRKVKGSKNQNKFSNFEILHRADPK